MLSPVSNEPSVCCPPRRDLVVASLRELFSEYNLEGTRLRAATARVLGRQQNRAGCELRDNASVVSALRAPIFFGTIFLAGLQSDEGMLSVLAHELTHSRMAARTLLAFFSFVLSGGRAANLTGMRIVGRRPEELTCDLGGRWSRATFIEARRARRYCAEARASHRAQCVEEEE